MKTKVLIVGAGPVGLVTALGLCKAGIPVTIAEADETVCQHVRAAYYHPCSVDMLADLGALDALLEGGSKDRTFLFKDAALGRQAKLDISVIGRACRHDFALSAAQSWFTHVLARLLEEEDCEFLFGHPLTALRQDGEIIHTTFTTKAGEVTRPFDWVIGCDGAHSIVRKMMDIDFEGYTWPQRFHLMHTRRNMEAEYDRLSYIANGPDWRLVIRIPYGPNKEDWLFRIVSQMPEVADDAVAQTPEFMLSRAQAVDPSLGESDLFRSAIYNVHQQVAKTFRRGRVILAGDAAHLNNPLGGQGLNAGIHDAVNLVEKFTKMWRGDADETILDLYDRQRRQTNWNYIQPISVENKQRNEETDLKKRAAAMDRFEAMAKDDDARFAFLYRWSMCESLDFAANIT